MRELKFRYAKGKFVVPDNIDECNDEIEDTMALGVKTGKKDINFVDLVRIFPY